MDALDRATGAAARRPRASRLTPKKAILAESYLEDPTAATAVHARRANYAEASFRNAGANGIVPREAAKEYLAAQRAAGNLDDKSLRGAYRKLGDLLHEGVDEALGSDMPAGQKIIGASAGIKSINEIVGADSEQDADLASAAAREDFNVHRAQDRLELAQQLTAEGADVQAILEQLQADLEAALDSQSRFQLQHGRKVTR